jgi:hypothetical protein
VRKISKSFFEKKGKNMEDRGKMKGKSTIKG